MNAAVGPLRISPPTIGLTATTGARRADAAPRACRGRRGSGRSRRAGWTGRSRSRARSRSPRAPRALGSRPASAPRSSRPSTVPSARLADHELLKGAPAGGRADPGAHRVVAHRQHPRAQADRPLSRASAAVGAEPSSACIRARSRHHARSRSPRLNHTSRPSSRSAVHDREAVAAQAPAARRRSGRRARRRRGRGRARRARRRSRCHRRCWRSRRAPRARRRRACRARASPRRCRRRARRRRLTVSDVTPRARQAGP